MISVLRKVTQSNIKYRKKWGPHNRCLHWYPTLRSYGPGLNDEPACKNLSFVHTATLSI